MHKMGQKTSVQSPIKSPTARKDAIELELDRTRSKSFGPRTKLTLALAVPVCRIATLEPF
jgi:hypothetical protein